MLDGRKYPADGKERGRGHHVYRYRLADPPDFEALCAKHWPVVEVHRPGADAVCRAKDPAPLASEVNDRSCRRVDQDQLALRPRNGPEFLRTRKIERLTGCWPMDSNGGRSIARTNGRVFQAVRGLKHQVHELTHRSVAMPTMPATATWRVPFRTSQRRRCGASGWSFQGRTATEIARRDSSRRAGESCSCEQQTCRVS